jgi:hypothetical protein
MRLRRGRTSHCVTSEVSGQLKFNLSQGSEPSATTRPVTFDVSTPASHHQPTREQTVSPLSFRHTTVKRRSRIAFEHSLEAPSNGLSCDDTEPMTGIEPAYSAWEAASRAERAFCNGWSTTYRLSRIPTATAVLVRPGTRMRYGAGTASVRWSSGYRQGTACAGSVTRTGPGHVRLHHNQR